MDNVTRLIQTLQEQNKIYNDLLDVAKNKTDIIIEGKVKELENITKVEQSLVLSLGKLEDQIEEVINNIKNEFNITQENITLSVIMEHLSDQPKEQLATLRDEIYDVIEKLKETNNTNSELIQNSLDYINFSVNLLSNANSKSSGGYQQSGEIQVNKTNLFDKKL